MRIAALAALLAVLPPAAAQEIYDTADPMPALEGGLEALQAAITYPPAAREAGVAGRVLVAFVVDAEGDVAQAAVLRGAHPLLDAAALDALRRARFTPGRLQGTPVAVRMVLPVDFTLDGAAPTGPETPAQTPAPEAAPEGEPDTAPPEPDTAGEGVAMRVDQMPEIVGGLGAVVERVVYPPEAEAAGIEGRVFVTFVVTEAGTVEAAAVVESTHPLLDEAALAAVRATPFRPGLRDGEPVRVQMVLPITFALPDRE